MACFNCNSLLVTKKKLSYNVPSVIRIGKENVRLSEAVSAVFKTEINIRKHTGRDGLALVLCSGCDSLFTKLYKCRNTFLSLTSQTSFVKRLLQFNKWELHKVTCDNLCIKSEKAAEIIKKNPDLIFHKSESILPDFEDEEPNPTSSLAALSSFQTKINEVIDIREVFPQLKISKLTNDEIMNVCAPSLTSLNYISTEKEYKSTTNISVCKVCKREFLNSESMESHYNSVHNPVEIGFNCTFCQKQFSSEWFYKTHLQKLHFGVEIKYSCTICKNTFYNQQKLEQHKKEVHDIRKHPFNCNHCQDSFLDICELREHLIDEHPNTQETAAAIANKILKGHKNRRKCTVCDQEFPDWMTLSSHMKCHHGKVQLCCSFCNKTFKGCKTLLVHEKEHTVCSLCNNAFKNSYRLKLHIKQIHEGRTAFKCEICGQSFKKAMTINRHYRLHSNIGSPFHHCNLCNKSYPLTTQLSQHMKNCHSTTQKSKANCEYCDKIFTHKYELNKHLEIVHKMESKFSCEICGKKFMWKASLVRHNWCHAKQKFSSSTVKLDNSWNKIKDPISNESKIKTECYAFFSSETYLFSCPRCNKTEIYKNHFIRHLRKHNIIGYTDATIENKLPRSLKCPFPECIKGFSRKDTLQKHIRAYHTLDSKEYVPKPFTCKICKKTMLSMAMNSHGKRHMLKIKVSKGTKASAEKTDLNSYYNETENEFRCPTCQEYFPSEKQCHFIEHLETSHQFRVVNPSNDVTVFRCSLCNKSFDSLVKREKHFLLSHCKKNY